MRISFLTLLLCIAISSVAQTQNWVPSTQGILDSQRYPSQVYGFHINFKPNGPFGKDWIYGYWLDEDTLQRHVAYREGGKWKPLPFYTEHGSNFTGDIVQYGDTMYIGGLFGEGFLDGDTSGLPNANILKYWPGGDSIWASDVVMAFIDDMEVSGDSLLVHCSYLFSQTDTLGRYVLTTDGGVSWSFAFSPYGPDSNNSWGDPRSQMEIRDGKVYVLYEGSGAYNGVVSWDGQSWQGYGQGFYGGVWMTDFEFYNDQLFLGGTFGRGSNSLNPGDGIVGLNGQYWENTGGGIFVNQGGILPGGVEDLFSGMDVLFAAADASYYGDALIPYLAGWDGYNWCGTPITYGNSRPSNFGVIKDTLYAVCPWPATANGVNMGYLNYFDGDYLNGSNAICSTAGLGEEESTFTNEEIKVYPNPVSDVLHVALPKEVEEASYTLLTLDGKELLNGKLSAGQNGIEIREKRNGVFLLQITSDQGVVVKKVVFEY